ncbi:uncharacterized protein ACIQIH_004017 isoform 1-T11 [Cyanocitta cristata]
MCVSARLPQRSLNMCAREKRVALLLLSYLFLVLLLLTDTDAWWQQEMEEPLGYILTFPLLTFRSQSCVQNFGLLCEAVAAAGSGLRTLHFLRRRNSVLSPFNGKDLDAALRLISSPLTSSFLCYVEVCSNPVWMKKIPEKTQEEYLL